MASKTQRELAFLLTGKDVSASRSMQGATREVQKLERIAGKAGTNVARNLERGLLLGGTAAVGAIGYAIKAAQSFESATAGVAKTVDGDITDIITGLRDLAKEAPIAYEELAAIAETAGALGVAKGDILAFTETVAKLAVTTDLTSEAAATALGHLKTNLKLTGDAFEHVGNTVVDLGNKGASTESQIIGMAEGVSGVANIVGLSTPQVLGWGAAWANTGEEVEAGSTELQKFFLGTFDAVNKGGAELKTLAKVAGVSSKQFAAAYRKDASGTLADFLTKLGKLSKVEQAATLEKLGFTDQRITRGLLKILGNTDNLTDSLGIATTAWSENNAMQIEADKRFATSASQMKILENNIRDGAATIGTELLPVVNELARQGVDWLQGHQPEIKQFAKDLASNIRDAVKWAESLDWDAIGKALGAGADAAKAIVGAFMAMPEPLQQLLTGAFVANKLTGGAVQDLLKFAVRQMAIQAGVVNVMGGVVNGGVGGAAGAAGQVITGGGSGLANGLLRKGGGLAAVLGGSWLLGEAAKPNDLPTKASLGIAGGAATIGGGALAFGPVGAIVGAALATFETQQNVSNASSAQASGLTSALDSQIAGGATLADLRTSLAGVEAGIAQISSNPLYTFVQGDALDQLKAMRDKIESQLALQVKNASGSPDERQAAKDQKNATDRVYDSLEQNRITLASKIGSAAQYQAQQTAAAIRDIHIPAPSVSVSVVSNITVRETVRQQQVSIKYGRVAS